MADDTVRTEVTHPDAVRHGIDNDPNNDPEKAAVLGGVGGAVVGAAAGAMAGPVGAVAGAVIGGLVGAGGSGIAVGAVDRIDNDNTVSGLGNTPPEPGDPTGTVVTGPDGRPYVARGPAEGDGVPKAYPEDLYLPREDEIEVKPNLGSDQPPARPPGSPA
ncbi:MAG TPA: hypothetical protein VGN26_16430 [Armatimonadota bacterium]